MNTQMKIDGTKDLFKALDGVVPTTADITAMNKERAISFRNYVKAQVAMSGLGLEEISEATEKIQDASHPPLFLTGKLLQKMIAQNEGADGIAGYSKRSSKVPESDKTYYDIVALQHAGYRIPLAGEKGARVRKFLAAHGIFPSADKSFLEVKPRPFLFNALARYTNEGKDTDVINKFVQERINK